VIDVRLLLVVVIVFAMIFDVLVVSRLRTRYPAEYEKLGSPPYLLNTLGQLSFLAWVSMGGYWRGSFDRTTKALFLAFNLSILLMIGLGVTTIVNLAIR